MSNGSANTQTRHQIERLTNEAMRYFLAKQFDQAKQQCDKILALNLYDPNARNLLGKIAEQQNDLDGATTHYTQGLEHNPNHAGLIASLGFLSVKLGDGESAIGYWQQLVRLQPRSPDAWQALAVQWAKMQQWDRAEAAYKKSISLAPARPNLHAGLGEVLIEMSRHDEAIEHLQKASAATPDDLDLRHILAKTILQTGDMERAFSLFHKILDRNPKHANALNMLLSHSKSKDYNDDIKMAEAAFNDATVVPDDKRVLSFGLGKAWERIGDYDKSFHYYAEGNRISQETANYDIQKTRQEADQTKAVFSQEFLAKSTGACSDGEGLLFIVGMPRSGSTLLATILSSHPEVVDTGESDRLGNIISVMTGGSGADPILENVPGLSPELLNEGAAEYQDILRRFYGDSANYIDKTLPNLWLVGFIRIMFPKAKILHSARSAPDNCFSIFANGFAGSALNFSYDMENIGRHYRICMEMMDHWREVIPADSLYEVSYETLTGNPEEETRKLLEFCGLEWNDACLNFYKSKKAVQTSSLSQVRQPIYRSSVERWKRYEKHLQPLIDALGDAA